MSEQNEPLTPERAFTRIETLLSDIANRLDDIARHLDTVRYEVHMQTMTFARSQLRADRDRNGKSLRPWYGQVYSQNGEDGMIAEIFHRLGGPRSRVFIEIGAGDGMQNNTRFLLEQGWRGLWIEGSAADAPAATETFRQYVETGELQIAQRVVTPQNVNEIVAAARVPDEVDFLSVDIDQHTHTIWEASSVKARVHCVEYNGSIPPSLDLGVPYDAGTAWDGTNFLGAGLKTLERIGRKKGLNLVGCDLTGLNAFFVDAAICADHFLEPFTAENHYELPTYGRTHDIGHFASRIARHWLWK